MSQNEFITYTELINRIEATSDFVFNYDVAETNQFTVDNSVEELDSPQKIELLFRKSPFDIKRNGNSIIIKPATKRLYTTCGHVQNKLNNEALAFASIINETGTGVQTDENGYFEFDIESYKHQTISISYLGFNEKAIMVQDAEECSQINMSVNTDLFNEEIIIKGYVEKGIQEGASFGSTKINNPKIDHSILGSDKDILRSVQHLPGINSTDDSATNLNIRGSSADQNLIVWEDVTLYNTGHLFGMISSINPYLIKETKIYKGVYGPDFANRIGGVVDIHLVDKVPSALQAGIGGDMTQAHAFLQLPLLKDKIGISIGGRKSAYGFFENTPTLKSYTNKVFQLSRITTDSEQETEENESELEMDFYDVNTKLIAQIGRNTTFESSQFYAHNNFKFQSALNSLGIQTSDTLHNNTAALSNSLNIQWNRTNKSSIQFLYSNFEQEYSYQLRKQNTTSEKASKSIVNDIKEYQFILNHKLNVKQHLLHIGYEFDHKAVSYDWSQRSTFGNQFVNKESLTGYFHHLFGNMQFSINRFTIDLGSRLTYQSKVNSFRFAPRFHLKHQIFKQLSLKLSAGTFYQDVRQLYDVDDGDLSLVKQIWIFNTEKDSEILTSHKLNGGLLFSNKEWLVELESYFHFTRGISARNPSIRNSLVIDDMGKIKTSGLDILIHRKWKDYSSAFYYTVSSNQVSFPSLSEEDDSEFFPANNDQTHILQFIQDWKYKNFSFNANIQYKTGLPFSDPSSVEEYEDEDSDEVEYEIGYELFNSARHRDYIRLDIGVNYKKQFSFTNTEFGFGIQNLFSRVNIASRNGILTENNPDSSQPQIVQLERRLLGRTLTCYFNASL